MCIIYISHVNRMRNCQLTYTTHVHHMCVERVSRIPCQQMRRPHGVDLASSNIPERAYHMLCSTKQNLLFVEVITWRFVVLPPSKHTKSLSNWLRSLQGSTPVSTNPRTPCLTGLTSMRFSKPSSDSASNHGLSTHVEEKRHERQLRCVIHCLTPNIGRGNRYETTGFLFVGRLNFFLHKSV